MMEEVMEVKETSINTYNPNNYERATIEEYGYKEHKGLKLTWNIVSKVLLVFAVFMLYFSVIIIAIQSFNASDSTTEFTGFTFANYGNMFTKTTLNEAIFNTFKTSIMATIIATVIGTLVGIGAFFLPPKLKARLTLLNNIPLLNADIVTGISLMLIFSLLLPINNHIFGFWTILIAHIYFILPYIVLSVLPKMKEIDPNMLDASLDLGIKPFKSVVKVLVPAIKGGIFSGLVLAFTISFEDFVVGYFTTGNGYNTLSIWIYSSIGKKSLFPGVYAFSTALTVLAIIAIIIYNVVKGRIKNEKADR
ncbi:MAG: ABC transporter permease [Acholeplasmatales bacterium]|nr:ABC transporter permease [Acholeplasmatales bacterium]